ncbi:hypothetical protein MSAN_00166500 [Mycena sanguinolenta]|uniref:Uncharacterized protein n=1 Tax=Mycena sanguinolenta TaxID=230812 RepID=A0A8H6ZEB1_9AGAR|nr:hypothetical protein MSAN_00166500 [Mycena sanguinolenta]
MEPILRPNGNLKSAERSTTPAPAKPAPMKNTTSLHRPVAKPLNGDDLDTPPYSPSDFFPDGTQSKSMILSPRAQARLNQFDQDLAAQTQESAGKTPLFLPATSETPEPTIPPPRSRSPSHADSRRSISRSPSRSHSPSQRGPSPDIAVSGYVHASPASRPAYSRHSSRRGADDSYRVGDVPETQSTPEGSSSPSRAANPKKTTLKSQMKGRSKASGMIPPPMSPTFSSGTKPLALFGPIPRMTVFKARALREEDVDEPMSSIEQFSSPVKGAEGKKGQPRTLDVKGKGRAVAEHIDDEYDDEDDLHQRVAARGAELAEAARAERRAGLADYAERWKAKRTLGEIRDQRQQRAADGAGADEEAERVEVSMVTTESDGPTQSTSNGPGRLRHTVDVIQLRQEEEENTQDVRAFYEADQDHEDEDAANGDANRSEAGESARSALDRSVTTEVDGDYDIDIPEKVAWSQERASQQNLAVEHPIISQEDELMPDDLMEDNLMYPPSDDEQQSPQQEHGAQGQPEMEEGSEVEVEEEEIHSQDVASLEAQLHPSDEQQGSAAPPLGPPVVPNGRLSKSRSTSARPSKPTDDADLELPPTASTNHDTSEAQSVPVEPVADPRLAHATMELLNAKSEENLRLAGQLSDANTKLAAAEARNSVLQVRIKTLEAQSGAVMAMATSTDNSDLAERLRAAEELLAAERASTAAALQSKADAEAERDAARRELAAAEHDRDVFQECYQRASQFTDETGKANRELEKRVKIAEEQTKEGVSLLRATFELREETLKSEIRDWRNQAVFLREQAVRTNDDDLRKRAAEHPELVAKYTQLAKEVDTLEEKVEFFEEDLRVKQDEIDRLEQQLSESNDEIADLKAEKLVNRDTQVYRCGWRAEGNIVCPAFCTTQEDLDLHASMHIVPDPRMVNPFLPYASQ